MSTNQKRTCFNQRTSESCKQRKQQSDELWRPTFHIKAAVMVMILIVSISAFAQKSTGDARTGGTCSPAVTGNGNTFYFNYCGNDPEERAKIMKVLTALAQGQDLTNSKLDQILELLGTPPKISPVRTEQEVVPPGKPPRTSITFYTEDPISRGQFEIGCDRPCSPVDVCKLVGGNQSLLATVSTDPTLAEFVFRRDFPNLTQCKLTVESRDDNPVRIVSIVVSRRLDHLVPNKEQPPRGVSAGGSWMQ